MSKIDIYTANDCDFCHEAKDYFNEKHLEFTEHNISLDKDAKKQLIKKGVMSVPFIVIDEHEMRGFNKEEIEALMK